jgi:transcriptional regulator with XRE-family HTH domain
MDVIGDIDRLRERVRAQRGHYAELARASGMSVSWLSKFGRGRYASPGVVTVQRLAVALDSLEREAA